MFGGGGSEGGKVWAERFEGYGSGKSLGVLPLRQAQGQDDGRNKQPQQMTAETNANNGESNGNE
jgi:hypothetical protein